MPVTIPTIAFVRQTSLITDAMIRQYMAAQQIQIDRDYGPAWGAGAKCLFVPYLHTIPRGVWPCLFLDRSDEASALGYHYLTDDGMPIMRVFVGDAIRNGLAWSVTASHEVLETLADAWIDNTVPVTIDGISYEYAREIADATEDDHFGYPINGVFMSDFVYPSWFNPDGKEPFTHRRTVHKPFALAEGGYIGRKKLGGEWEQVFADGAPTGRMVKGPESRTIRRFQAKT